MNKRILEPKINIIKLLNNETRLTIILYLSIFKHISFKNLVLFTGKSKSTVHHHLQKLLKQKIVGNAPTPPKIHGSSKYYELIVDFPGIDSADLDDIPKEDRNESIKSLFEMGLFLFNYSQGIINTLIKHGNKMMNGTDFNSDNNKEIESEKKAIIDEMESIVQQTSISVFPLSKTEYQKFNHEMGNFYHKFMNERKKSSFSKNLDDIYMLIYCGIPYGRILNRKNHE